MEKELGDLKKEVRKLNREIVEIRDQSATRIAQIEQGVEITPLRFLDKIGLVEQKEDLSAKVFSLFTWPSLFHLFISFWGSLPQQEEAIKDVQDKSAQMIHDREELIKEKSLKIDNHEKNKKSPNSGIDQEVSSILLWFSAALLTNSQTRSLGILSNVCCPL